MQVGCRRVKMSFLNISDPRKRHAIVKEYLATIKRIKNRNLAERAHDFAHHESLEESLEPVVRSTAASTEAITKELVPIKEGITALNTKLQTSKSEPKPEPEPEPEPEEHYENIFEQLVEETSPEKLDDYFGIVVTEANEYAMGDKIVQLSGNDINVDDIHYKGTPGLWSLIMFKKPDEGLYDAQDLETYKKLVYQTNVISSPRNLRPNSKIKATYKWRNIFSRLKKEEGQGIEFLPTDINSLQAKLAYLLGEFRAGNTSATRNEIVAIADNLLKRKHISKAEYKRINNFLRP